MGVEIYYRKGKQFEAVARGHKMIIDQPKGNEGDDEGPTPSETFMASLGACVGVYALAYCRTAGIDPTDMKISLKYQYEHKPYRIAKIDARIDLPKGDVGARKNAVLSAAHKCLIQNTLDMPPKVELSLTSMR